MRKVVRIIAVCAALVVSLSGCNKQIMDTTYHYSWAQFSMPDGTIIEGKVDSWTDYSDGDQIQVTVDGETYLVHSMNIVLKK